MADWAALEQPTRRTRERIGTARKDAPAERVVQRQIVKAFRKIGLRVVHVPNGVRYVGAGLERARQSAVLRADGLVPGCPDLIVGRPKQLGGPAMGWLEIKREGGELSDDQIAFRDVCLRDALPWGAVCSVEGALETLRAWGWTDELHNFAATLA